MALAELIIKEPWFKKLGVRASSFYEMMKHLDSFGGGNIIETGCAWDKNNWGGQGQSTLIWDWVLKQSDMYDAISFDITPEHVAIARSQVERVAVIESDSLRGLSGLDSVRLSSTVLLYLDSYDWYDELNFESAFHHMAELACVWSHLPKGCMIVVDDRHGAQRGKHWMVEGFMRKLGSEPVFCDYQVGFLKA